VTPAWYISRQPGLTAMGGGARHTGAQIRIRRVIVVAQIAVATALVAGGLLLDRSLTRLMSVPAGFAADRTLVVDVSLPRSGYSATQRAPFFERALERMRALPEVDAAGAGGPLPLSGSEGLLRFGAVHDRWRAGDTPVRAYVRWATGGYFAAMGIGVRAGRPIEAIDTAASSPVIVIDDQLARTLFGAANPVGRRVQLSMERGGSSAPAGGTWREVVGVVDAVHQVALDRGVDPHAYVPEAQMPSPALSFVVRGQRDPRKTLADVRGILRGLDPNLPLGSISSLDSRRDDSVAGRRVNAELLGAFAVSALLLTMVGVYGVMAQIVTQSTRELGIRVALGATATGVVALTLLRAAWMAIAGVLAGTALAWIGTPAIRGLLYGVGPHDPIALGAAAILLIAVALAAALVPARRLLRVDVVNALRDA